MSKLVLIIIVQLLFVPMLTLRTISMVKNLKLLTAVFGFLEALIYIFGLTIVLSGEQSILEMIVYSLGFSLGLIVGIIVEQKLAIGYISYHVNLKEGNKGLVDKLREEGFGVTLFNGFGKFGLRARLDILAKRKRQSYLFKLIYEFEPDAFVISYEPKMFKGGYLTDLMKRKMPNKQITPDDFKDENIIKRTFGKIGNEINELKKSWKS
ncbi:MAG: DUF2179 domain-containing protein [Acidaminobacteraceae bacterium]